MSVDGLCRGPTTLLDITTDRGRVVVKEGVLGPAWVYVFENRDGKYIPPKKMMFWASTPEARRIMAACYGEQP